MILRKALFVFVFSFVLSGVTGLVFGERLAILTEVNKPNFMLVDDNQIYIGEKFSIYIYSLETYKLKRKFGKQGEGPEEFKSLMFVWQTSDQLVISSDAKLSFFRKNGEFVKEIRNKYGINGFFIPLKHGYVGRGMQQSENIIYNTINLYDADLNKGKELFRVKSPQQETGKIIFLKQMFLYLIYDDKIYVASKEGFIIDVLDHTGRHLFSVNRKYERRKFTPDDEKGIRKYLKLRFGDLYDAYKPRLAFPEYFPAIQSYWIQNNQIIVLTWKTMKDKFECFIFDLKGELLKKTFLPFAFDTPVRAYPYQIWKGKLYQVIYNEDIKEWELHVTNIK